MPALDRQLRLLRAYALFTYPFACVPFLYLFFRQHGLDQQGFGEVVAIYYVAMFLAEVPTGVFADRFGPKVMLVVGPLLLSLGFGTLVAFPCYPGFVAGEMLLGFGHAVLSGPPAVMLYEALKQHGQEHRYLAEEAKVNARRLYGTGTSFLLGGLLARTGNAEGTAFELTVVLTCVLTATAAVLALRLAPQAGRPVDREFVRHAARDLRHPAVIWLLGYWIVLFTLLRYPFHNYQPYMDAASDQEPLLGDAVIVGFLFAMMNVVAAPLSALAPRLVARFGRIPLFYGMPLILAGTFLVMGFERHAAGNGEGSRLLTWIAVGMFFAQQVPFGLHTALLQEFVNHRISSNARTTVLSVLSLGARLVYAGCNLLLFRSQQQNGMAMTMFWAGGLGIAATVVILWLRPRGMLRGTGRVV